MYQLIFYQFAPYSYLYNNIKLDEDIQPSGYREINRLDHIVTNNIKTNKDQHNDAIDNEQTPSTSSNC